MKILMLAGVVCALAAVGGCASSADKVSAAYVSPIQYQSYTCDQLNEEAIRISQRAQELTGAQNSKRTKDAVATTAAIIIFWPAAFFVGGDDAQTAELARMKGSVDAIQQMQIQKNCTQRIEVAPASKV